MRRFAAKAVGSDTLMSTGLSMLIPQAYEIGWTALGDGIFNDYPPQASAPDDSLLSGNTSVESDATFGQSIPIPYTTSATNALVAANARRGYLLLQNNSSGQAGDVLPNLYAAFDGPVPAATPYLYLTIAPGSGVVFDRRPPGNAIYVLWGTFTNTSGKAVAGGVLQQGLLPVS